MPTNVSRRSVLAGAGASFTAVGLSGCQGGGGGGDDTYSIGFQVAGLGNSWFKALANGAQWYGEGNGMNVNIGNGELDSTTGVTVARNLVNSNIDALVVNPLDGEAMADVVDQAA